MKKYASDVTVAVRPKGAMAFSYSKPKYVSNRSAMVLKDKGRWGPRWLHRLIISAARNCGLLSHDVRVEEIVQIKLIRITEADIRNRIAETLDCYLRDTHYRPDQLVCYIGHPDFKLLTSLEFGDLMFDADLIAGNSFCGVTVVVCPNLDGCFIVPKRLAV